MPKSRVGIVAQLMIPDLSVGLPISKESFDKASKLVRASCVKMHRASSRSESSLEIRIPEGTFLRVWLILRDSRCAYANRRTAHFLQPLEIFEIDVIRRSIVRTARRLWGQLKKRTFMSVKDSRMRFSTLNRRALSYLGSRVYGLAAIERGLIGVIWGDFATFWQPVPASFGRWREGCRGCI
jgi:hypothetical protein